MSSSATAGRSARAVASAVRPHSAVTVSYPSSSRRSRRNVRAPSSSSAISTRARSAVPFPGMALLPTRLLRSCVGIFKGICPRAIAQRKTGIDRLFRSIRAAYLREWEEMGAIEGGHRMKRFFVRLPVRAAGLLWAGTAGAANGDNLRQITADTSGTACPSIGTGLAFDGTNLLLSCWSDDTIAAVSPADGHQVAIHHILGG